MADKTIFMEKPRHPHDHFFRQSFGLKEVAIDYLRNFLPLSLSEKLQFETIERVEGSFVSRKLRAHISDIIYRCAFKESETVFLTFLFEHKSKPEAYPHVQLLRYILEGWERAIKENAALPLIVPIIVYHGKTAWEIKPLSAYFKGWDESLSSYLPSFEYLLTDLSRLDDEVILNLRARFLINVLLSLKHQGEKRYLLNNVQHLFHRLDKTGRRDEEKNYIEMLLVYMLVTTEFSDEDWEEVIEKTSSSVKELAMTTYDVLIKKGEQQGIEKGIEQGVEQKAREVIHTLIREFPEFSDSRIALLAQVEEAFVYQIRLALLNE